MNDDALSPELELASAYLDGDLDEGQRATAEASPAVMAMVASLEQVKVQLRATPPADAGTRDAAVAAALAEFDVLRAPPVAAAESSAASNVVPMQRRARWSKVVMSAAAALLIGGVGVAAINSFGGSSDQSTSADPAAAKEVAGDTAAGAAAGGAEDGAPATINAINGAATAVPQLEEPEQLQAFATMPAGSPTADSAFAEADTASTLAAATETTAAAAGEVTSAPDTQSGTGTADTSASAVVATSRASAFSFAFDCPLEPTQVVLLEITWKGTPAVAVRDTVTGVIQAVDAQCTVLATAGP
jgi:hypothetical protein